MRILLAVTHLLGSGHLVRTAAVGRALAARGHATTLVSGGLPNRLVPTGGMRFVQLPPVRAEVEDFSTLRDEAGAPVTPERMAARRALLLDTVRASRPDIVVVELYPFGRRGLRAEFDALLEAAEAARPRPLVACSIRDILVAPGKPEKIAAAHACLARHVDVILVHGDPAVVPLETSWPLAPGLRPRLAYTGYVGPDGEDAPPRPETRGETVLVSGGASAASLPLYRAALDAAASEDRPWHILVGGSVEERSFRTLADNAPPRARVERARSDFRDLMRKAAVFVGQAGYNTVMDIVATQTRAVLVPFEQGRETEQRLRAEALAARGLVGLLPESELSGARLSASVQQALGREAPHLGGIGLDGAARTAEILEDLAGRASAGMPVTRVA